LYILDNGMKINLQNLAKLFLKFSPFFYIFVQQLHKYISIYKSIF